MKGRIIVVMVAMLMGIFVNVAAQTLPEEPIKPIPEPIVWLAVPQLHTAQDSAIVELGLRQAEDGGAYISVGVEVIFDLQAQPIRARLGPGAADGWSIVQSISGDTLRVVMAGVYPLLRDEVFLRITFDTSLMSLGNVASIEVWVRLNENPGVTLYGVIEFRGLYGDVSLDGEVTAYDAALILQYYVGIISEIDYPGLFVADVSGNSEVTGYDAALILQYVVGIIDHFPVEKLKPEPPPPEEPEEPVGKLALFGPRTIELGEVEEVADGFSIPVLIDEMSGVISGKVEISFKSGLKVVSVEPGELLGGYLLASREESRRLRVAFAGSQSATGAGELFRLNFDSDPRGLRITDVRLNEGQIPVNFSVSVETNTWGQVKSRFK